jgi:hypothetical protein
MFGSTTAGSTGRRFIRRCCASQVRNETARSLGSAFRQPLQWHDLILFHVSAINCVSQSIKRLFELTVGCAQVSRKLSRNIAAEAFGYQPWRRTRGISQLVVEIAITPDRARPNQLIDTKLQLIGKLPDDEVLVGSHTCHATVRVQALCRLTVERYVSGTH